ncbi:amino acid ABC transporter ATP-binding/permease protein [Marinomonas piezotolerans]|uniref:amino acid ABC transporter ATP-binding/permease protein n=1 Tax=Marinomonas piezotolerans TaxID=2213058 RepID=UPI001FE258C8|nr:ATP-binding cassette domain-containing protein [Marinomonas piezotolerans]
MSKHKPSLLTFKSLLFENPFALIVSILIGAVASLAAVALLGISGWFLSAAGLASAVGSALVFNYFTPGATIRLMAILRTAGRYGEQVFSHDHLLGMLRSLRLWVWDQRAATMTSLLSKQTRGDLLQRLVGDLDQIIKWPLAVVMPWVYGCLACVALMAVARWVYAPLIYPVVIFTLAQLILWPWLANQFASRSVYAMQALSIHRRSRFMSVFSSLITLTIRGHWHQYSERLNVLDQRQRQAHKAIQQVTSGIKLAYQLTSFALIVSLLWSCVLIQQGEVLLRPNIESTMLVALILAVLGVNELVQPLATAFIAQGQSKVGLKRLNQLRSGSQYVSNSNSELSIPSIELLELDQFAGIQPLGIVSSLVNTSIVSGSVIRLVGKSGAGKSTCLAALAGDLPHVGDIRINKDRYEIFDNPKWRDCIAYLSQESIIFQQSLASNLRLGAPNATDEQLMSVLNVLGLKEWVESLPKGLDTLLGAQGRDVSGGQARRINLARVLLRKSEIILLDEPFDGLDRGSITRICEALREGQYQPKILVYVSHIDSELDDFATETVFLVEAD